ncbi:MAG: CHAD domain-containing protein [Burkholderiales bacterium]
MAIERELTFRLASRSASAFAKALALGRAQRFASTYFDTPRHELRRARVALRLRRAGRHSLQTVKADVAAFARGEWETEAPLGRFDFAHLPLAEIRDATGLDIEDLATRLEPQFETRFARRAAEISVGDATIEAALDHGAITAAGRREPILEVELELKSGEPRVLFRYARSLVEPFALQLALESKAERGYRLAQGAGVAPPRKWQCPELAGATPARALGLLVSAALAQAAANACGLVDSDEAEYLHQLRVAFRRLRATLVAFRALEPEASRLKRRLRALSPTLGAARDWDVFAASLPKRSGLARRARKRQAETWRAARALLASAAFSDFLLRGFEWVEKGHWNHTSAPLAAFAAQALERLHQKALKFAERIDWQAPSERHSLRIRVKRLRYTCDSLAACFTPAAVAPYLAALEVLQDDLGELNDIAVGRRLAGELAGGALLERRFAGRERRLIGRLSRDWRSFRACPPFWRSAS